MSRKRKSSSKFKYKLSKSILKLFKEAPSAELGSKDICNLLSIKDKSERKLVFEVLLEMEQHEILAAVSRDKFKLATGATSEAEGILDFNHRGSAYLISDAFEDDIYIHFNRTGKAFNKDKVRCRIFKRNGKLEGEVTEILERHKDEFVGTVDIGKKTVFVRPEDTNMPVDFFIDRGHLKGAKNGEKVIVKFLTWPTHNKSPYGAVIERLGMPGKNGCRHECNLGRIWLPN